MGIWTILGLNKLFTLKQFCMQAVDAEGCRRGACTGREDPYGHAFLFPLSCSSPTISWKRCLSVHWKTSYTAVSRKRQRHKIVHLTSRPSHFLSHLFPHHCLLFLPQHFCTFPLLPINVVCSRSLPLALSLLNNNPSVCKCLWDYFWPLQGHKALSSLLVLFFYFCFCLLQLCGTEEEPIENINWSDL